MADVAEMVREGAPRAEGAARARPARGELKIIRATRIEEIDAIRDIAHEFHAESRYAHLPFSGGGNAS